MNLVFASCFSEEKIKNLRPVLQATYRAMWRLAPWIKAWPSYVECMRPSNIISGRKGGAGHGQYEEKTKRIFLNPHMTPFGLWLNLIHENMHHAFPDATEKEINQVLVPWVYKEVTGKVLNFEQARLAGFGPPVRGIRGRGYAE